jgi:hypothetical protein
MATFVRVPFKTGTHDFPFGSTSDHFVASLGNGVPDVNVPMDQTEVVFEDVPPGDYIASVQMVDTMGNPLGDPAMSSQFNVHAEFVSLTIPVSVSPGIQEQRQTAREFPMQGQTP